MAQSISAAASFLLLLAASALLPTEARRATCSKPQDSWWGRHGVALRGEAGALTRRALQSLAGTLTYHKGFVITSDIKVYMVYIGYTKDDAEPKQLNHLVKNLQPTGWWKVMTKYYAVTDGKKVYYTGKISLGGTLYIDVDTVVSKFNADLSGDTSIPDFISAQIDSSDLPKVKNAIYVLVPSETTKDQITWPKEFCEKNCAWHSYNDYTYDDGSSFRLFFSFVPAQTGCDSCTSDILKAIGGDETKSPTGSNNIDAMVDSLVHELAETLSDPLLDGGWYDDGVEDKAQNENGDVCAGKYGKLKTKTIHDADGNANDVMYNQMVGGHPYVFQQIWNVDVNPKTKKQYCCVASV